MTTLMKRKRRKMKKRRRRRMKTSHLLNTSLPLKFSQSWNLAAAGAWWVT